MSNIESNLKKLLKGEKACIPEHFLKVPSYNSPTLRTGKGRPISEGAFGKMYRGSINDNGRRYVAYKEIDTSESTDGAFEFEFKVAEKLKEFAVPEMYLFKKCPIQDKEPQRIRKGGKPGSKMGHFVQPSRRTKPKDILYMELLDGMSFNSWWKTNPSLDAIKSVIVQVFDNLYRINQKFPDFRHRDLHGGNVMVSRREGEYTWKVDLGRKVIRNDPGGSFRSRLGSPDIKKYKRTNAGVEAHIIDFGLSYWSRRMPNPETADGGYEGAGIYGHGIGPGTIYYDIHRFLYTIYVKVRQPENAKERAIKNFIEELIPNKEFLQFNGKFTSQGYLLSDYHVALRANLPTFKTILTHPFLTGEGKPNRPKTVTEALKMLPKAKTPPKIKTPKAKTKTPSPKLSTEERKKKMNSAIKRAAAILAKPKAKPAPLRRPGAVRPNPVPEIQPASPSPKADAPYGVMSPSNMLEYARKIESGRKKAANKLNARIKEIKATKGKTPTPVRLKEKFSFVNVKGKKREFVRKFAYDRALAKNKAEREKAKAKTPTPEEAGKEWNKRYKETFGITFKEIPNYVMPPAAHNRHMGMINNRREYVNDRIKGKTPSFGYIATTAERAKEAKANAKAKTPTPKAKKNEYWRSFVDVNGKKQEFESKSAYHEAKQKNLQAYGAKMQAKINRQIQLGRDTRFSFVDVNGKKREYVRKGMYEKALAKNKAERSLRAKIRDAMKPKLTPKAKTVTPKVKTPTPKKAVNMYINKFVNKLDKDEVNALKKKICQP
jgi:serine/threonine protein kinase